MSEIKTVLILTADAGFGHRAAATAVAAALRERYGDACRVAVANPMQSRKAPRILRRAQTDYDRIVQAWPELYRLGFEASDGTLTVGMAEQALIIMLYAALNDLLQLYRPHAIVTTYPLYQAPLTAIFALSRRYVPLITVVTDLATVHSLWFNEDVDLCLVPTEVVRQKALEHGVPAERIEVTGLPVHPEFGRPADRAALRAALGWGSERYVALCAGSARVTRLEPVTDALNHSGLPLELALVAGGNDRLAARWREMEWHQPAHIYGYVEEMARMILAADFLICKAGGVIVSEGLAAAKPLLLVEVIPGQEVGNAEWVVQGGAGELAADPLAALATVYHWLDQGGRLLKERSSAAGRLGRPMAAARIADLVYAAAVTGSQRQDHRLLRQVGFLRELLRIQ